MPIISCGAFQASLEAGLPEPKEMLFKCSTRRERTTRRRQSCRLRQRLAHGAARGAEFEAPPNIAKYEQVPLPQGMVGDRAQTARAAQTWRRRPVRGDDPTGRAGAAAEYEDVHDGG